MVAKPPSTLPVPQGPLDSDHSVAMVIGFSSPTAYSHAATSLRKEVMGELMTGVSIAEQPLQCMIHSSTILTHQPASGAFLFAAPTNTKLSTLTKWKKPCGLVLYTAMRWLD